MAWKLGNYLAQSTTTWEPEVGLTQPATTTTTNTYLLRLKSGALPSYYRKQQHSHNKEQMTQKVICTGLSEKFLPLKPPSKKCCTGIFCGSQPHCGLEIDNCVCLNKVMNTETGV